VYVRRPNAEERETGAEPLTQFGRMCAALGIQIIPASSPQAKGRIERNHGTHQDRLVKKLRRQAIADVETANAFLETAYWTEHNQRFAQPPASAEDFHVPVPRGVRLDTVFRLEEKRRVSNDWVVRYDNRLLQLERQSGHPPARSMVLVREAADGTLEVRYRGQRMRWTEIAPATRVAAAASAAEHAPGVPQQPVAPVTRRWHPGRDHPWRKRIQHDIVNPGPPIWQVAGR
jgi:hypothetical protein